MYEDRPQDLRKPGFMSGWLFAAAGMAALLVLGVVAYVGVQQFRTPVTGGIRLGAEPGVNLYVGDRLLGAGVAEAGWSEIFGWSGAPPLGIVLPPEAGDVPEPGDALKVGMNAGWIGEATAERLGGTGAKILRVADGNPPRFSYKGRHKYEQKEFLLRRQDGTLDQVFCLDVQLTSYSGKRYRALVPIRPRATGTGDLTGYFSSDTSGRWEPQGGAVVRRFDNAHTRMVVNWGFETAEAPPELAAKIAEEGLWRPSVN